LDTHSAVTFASLGLSPASLDALRRAHYEHPTPIQEKAIPPALSGQDVIGCAATGTGKTAAFVLPMVERLKGRPGTRGLVLAPTRELAIQIAEHLAMFGQAHRVRGAVVIGGVSIGAQIDALRRQPEVIVATPGRLVDHLRQKTVSLAQIEILVLDEADRMLDMGFKPQLVRVLAALPRKRQSLLFSATMAGEVGDFARSHLSNPARVEVTRSGTTSARADQAVYLVRQLDKTALLLALLEAGSESMLVFTRTKRRADKVARLVERAGHRVARIHADRSQGQRRQALEGFKDGRYRVLIATDIAARGIDVEEIGHVVNYDVPHVPEDYVHRIGRTARAGAAGSASSFVSPEEAGLLRDIERFTRTPITRRPLPESSPAFQAEVKRAQQASADPGPPPSGHRHSGRPHGQPPGRHARTHPKHSSGGHPTGATPKKASSAPTHGTWRPQRRR
jgi:ATP-dependent RNA helicase RhlE